MLRFFQSVTFTLSIFGFAGWAYIAGNAIMHPESLSWPLTHLLPWPREDTFGIVCFAVSIVSTFVYRMIRDTGSPSL